MASEIIIENFLRAVGALSAFAGLTVVLTGMIFPQMVKKSQFTRIIMAIYICDILSTILVMAGFPTDESLCFAQGIGII